MAIQPKKTRAAKSTRANPNRGEHELVLGGVSYVLRPSFAACVAIENALDMSLIEVFRAAHNMALSYEQTGIAVAELIRAGATDDLTCFFSPERAAELIFECGAGSTFAALTLALGDAVMGGRTIEGELTAQALKTPTP